MIGEIVKIIPMKSPRYAYKRLIFKMNDGSFAKTDIVKGFRNEKRWKPFLHIGSIIDNLRMISPDKVDADSLPYKYRPPMTDEEMFRMGVFG
jgi:hypothetical protein